MNGGARVRALALSLAVTALHAACAAPKVVTTAPPRGEAGPITFEQWSAEPARRQELRAFEAFLGQSGVAGIVPTRELVLNASSWSECRLDAPFTLAARAYWPNIVNTLRYIRDVVVPAIGPVDAVSGYRNPELNRCAGGAPRSAHAEFYALDLTPSRPIERTVLIERMCVRHAQTGARYHIGLGFYDGLRFHVDSKSYRLWGPDHRAATSPCLTHPAT